MRAGRWGALLSTYSAEKRRWDATYPWIACVLRPLSFVVAWLLPSRVTANQVTGLSYVVALLSLISLAWGSAAGLRLGSVLLVVFNLLDCVDGNLARLRGTSAPFGRFLDALAAPAFVLPYFAAGIGLARAGGSPNGAPLLGAGAATTILKLLVPQVRHTFHLVCGENWERDKKAGESPGHAGRWYYRVYYNLTDLQAHDFVLVLAAFGGWLEAFLIASFVVGLVEFAGILALYLRRARRFR
jgi:hypothetical protein